MKRFFRSLTCVLLVSLLVVTSVPESVFAGKKKEEKDHSAKQYNYTNVSGTGVFPSGLRDGNTHTYMMVLEHGAGCNCNLESVIIKYKSAGSNGLITQVLNPYAGYNTNLYYGSKAFTYNAIMNNSYGKTAGGEDYSKGFATYLPAAKALVPTGLDNYKNPYDLIDNGIQSNETEYFYFALEFALETLESVSFIVSPGSGGLADWTLFDWAICDVHAIRATTFAKVSDRVGMIYDGTILYKTTDATNAKLQEVGIGGGAALHITFNNIENLPTSLSEADRSGVSHEYSFDRMEEEYIRDLNGLPDYIASTGDAYRTDMGAGDLRILCFEKCNISAFSRTQIYNFCINLADDYDGGLECLVKDATTGKMNIEEYLTAEIIYRTTSNTQQTVNLPVLANSLLEYYMTDKEALHEGDTSVYSNRQSDVNKWDATVAIHDFDPLTIAQQGETICFSVEFPDIKKLEGINLKYKNSANTSDQLGIQNILVYNNWGNKNSVIRSNYKDLSNGTGVYLSPDNNGNTMVYAADEGEPVYLNGLGERYDFTFYEPDDLAGYSSSYVPSYMNHSGEYLVQILTDDVPGVGTQANVDVELEFELPNGQIDSTGYIGLYDTSTYGEFNGYIRGNATAYTAQVTADEYKTYVTNEKGEIVYNSTSKVIDAGYIDAMSEGNSIYFFLDIGEIKKFTGVNFQIADSPDDWQPASISIYKINEDTVIGKRQIDANGGKTFAGTSGLGTKSDVQTGYSYSRQIVKAETVIDAHHLGFTMKNGMEVHEDFETGSGSGSEEKRQDYSEFKTSMDYATACSDLKLNVPVKTYEVRVKVASNATASAGTDNCGSANLFYFQLVFNSGQSAYVLANQQLDADGFRSGQKETFYITTNEDMGDIVAMNIIADDVTANASPLDKLCVEYIEVIKHNTNTLNKIFTFNNIGWITTEYTDVSEAAEKHTRAEADLAHSYTDISVGYALDLEFALTIGQNTATNPDDFEGYVTMDFVYQNQTSTGTHQERSIKGINIVQAMYDYRGDTPLIDKNQNIISDDKMFRQGTIDRFRLTITDCRILKYVRFRGYPFENEASLFISDVKVSMVLSEGVYSQVKNETTGQAEMTRVYDPGKEPKLIGQLKKQPTSPTQYANGGQNFLKLDFDSGSVIPELDPDTTLTSVVAREPDSQNDTLNYYLYLADGVPEPGPTYDLTTRISYETVESASSYNETTFSGYMSSKDGGHYILSKTGINAPKFAVLRSIVLTCSVINDNNLKADHAVIQHMRNGIIIDSYTIYFAGSIFGRNMGLSMLTAVSAKDSGSKQVVTMQLGADTPVMDLTAEENDIAVSIMYKSKSLVGSDKIQEFTSTNVFATDSGTTSIHPGSILTFEFNEINVQEITGIKVKGAGNVTATFNGANIKVYEPDANGQVALSGWFSVDAPASSKTTKNTETNIGAETLQATVAGYAKDSVKSLKLTEFTFLTTEESTLRDSSGTVPIRAKIMYKQTNGGTGVYEIDDIRSYVSSGDKFIPGAETTVSVFLPGLKSLRSIQLEPYDTDEDTAVSWNLDTVKYKAEGVDDESLHTMPVKSTIVENKGANLNLSTIYLDLKITSEGVVYETVNGTIDMSVEEGTTITFTPTIYESSAGYKVSVYKVLGGGLELLKSYGSDISSFDYTLTNDNTDNLTYRFVVQANENNAVESIVNVTVPPMKDTSKLNEGDKKTDDTEKTE